MTQYRNWEDFWQQWHNTAVETEKDLYYQVAKTINKEPIKKDIFDRINQLIVSVLQLTANDTLVELCCGNGLCTYEFSKVTGRVLAVDYSRHLIDTAKEHKQAPNITYHFDNVLHFLKGLKERGEDVSKYLMNDSLAYFEPSDLAGIVSSIKEISGDRFIFLIRGVPNDELKWNFYNTEERKSKYLDGVANMDFTNSGMGKWWKPAEIKHICEEAGVNCFTQNQVPPISDYRMDVLITGKEYVTTYGTF